MTLLDDVKRLDETRRVSGWDRMIDFAEGFALGIVIVAIIILIAS